MKKIVFVIVILTLGIATLLFILMPKSRQETTLAELKTEYLKKSVPSVDHSLFTQLDKKFNTPQEVTKECLTCHNRTAQEVMSSNHWSWEEPMYIKGRGIVYLGKKQVINNFCIGASGNEKSCAKCHIGLGMSSVNDLHNLDSTNIDCMVCHDNSETYAKGQEMGGAPDETVNLTTVAKSVGKPKRTNCGVCHFYGGGGNGVKHGDLEEAQFEPSKEIDIHMAVENSNLTCADCHKTDNHNISGELYSMASMNNNRSMCEDCHSSNPHPQTIINKHTLKVACQTCHIPVYAKANATKTYWDWSTAGKLRNGEPYEEDDTEGNHTYLSIKGSFQWGKNLAPEYVWFNGTASHYLLGDKIKDTSKPLQLNTLYGSYRDLDSKIIPVKVHRGKQPFDPETGLIIKPRLYAEEAGLGAFWQDFNWVKASEVGMQDVGLPFSGNVSFIETEMYWPLNHQVSAKEQSLKCEDCHTQNNSRLEGLTDFYMPARDQNEVIEFAGIGIIILSLFGIIAHSSYRIFAKRKNNKGAK